MSIEKELENRLKEAMRSKSAQEMGVLRMVKSQAQAKKTEPGFQGETDDAFWTEVITRYVKQQKKALQEFEKAGEQGRENADQLRFEIEYLAPFLPRLKSEDEVREIVKGIIAETGAAGPKMIGKVIGAVMKQHRDEVDAALVKKVASEELG